MWEQIYQWFISIVFHEWIPLFTCNAHFFLLSSYIDKQPNNFRRESIILMSQNVVESDWFHLKWQNDITHIVVHLRQNDNVLSFVFHLTVLWTFTLASTFELPAFLVQKLSIPFVNYPTMAYPQDTPSTCWNWILISAGKDVFSESHKEFKVILRVNSL